jgi:hypothetical protein
METEASLLARRADLTITCAGRAYPVELKAEGAGPLEGRLARLDARMPECGSRGGCVVVFGDARGKPAGHAPEPVEIVPCGAARSASSGSDGIPLARDQAEGRRKAPARPHLREGRTARPA